jgi:hypothetical protein
VARISLGGFGDICDGYVTALVAAEILMLPIGTASVSAAVNVMDSGNAAVVA